MPKKKLTTAQIEQLLSYLNNREEEGWYYGNQKHFETRHEELKKWLEELLEETSKKKDI